MNIKNTIRRIFTTKEETREHPSWRALSSSLPFVGATSARVAEGLSVVYAAVETISSACATLPPRIYKRDGIKRTRVDNHVLQPLLRTPNKHQTWPEFIIAMMSSCLLHGNAYAVFTSDNELVFIPPNMMTVEQMADMSLRYSYYPPTLNARTNTKHVATSNNCIHMRDRSDDGIMGRSRLSRCQATLGVAMQLQQMLDGIGRNGVFPSGAFVSKSNLSKDAREDLHTQIKANFAGGSNTSKVLMLDRDLDFKQMNLDPNQLQLAELYRQAAVVDVARVFNLSPILLGDLTNASYSNAAQAAAHLSRFTLQHWTTLFEAAFNRVMLPEEETLDLDLSIFSRGDTQERWEAYKVALMEKVLSPADVRHLEGYDDAMEGMNESN